MQILKTVLESTRPKYTDQLHINGSFLWISDFEIPYHDSGFLNKVFTLAKAWQINQVVWGGDALHLEAFSPFQPELNADEEISQIDEYLPGFLEPFEKVYWFVGNHDERLARRVRFGLVVPNHQYRTLCHHGTSVVNLADVSQPVAVQTMTAFQSLIPVEHCFALIVRVSDQGVAMELAGQLLCYATRHYACVFWMFQ